MIARMSQLISQKIRRYPEENQRDTTIALNTVAYTFRFASLASGAHQTYTGVE
jgi:hypothetical protein